MVCRGKSCTANTARRPGRLPCFCLQCIFFVESGRHIDHVFRLSYFSSQQVSLVRRMLVKYIASICHQMVVAACLPSCHNISTCRSPKSLARGGSTSLREFGQRLKADPVNACHLTRRAADKWDSPRFLGFCLASSGFRQSGVLSARPLAANADR